MNVVRLTKGDAAGQWRLRVDILVAIYVVPQAT